jgi:hypothetical protein
VDAEKGISQLPLRAMKLSGRQASNENSTRVQALGSTKRCLYLDARVSVAVSSRAVGSLEEDVEGN